MYKSNIYKNFERAIIYTTRVCITGKDARNIENMNTRNIIRQMSNLNTQLRNIECVSLFLFLFVHYSGKRPSSLITIDNNGDYYSNRFWVLASPYNLSQLIIEYFITRARIARNYFVSSLAACRLSFLPSRPSGFSSSQTLSLESRPYNERGPRSITAKNPAATFLSLVFIRLSLSPFFFLLHPPSFVLPSRTRIYVYAHARVRSLGI